MTLVPARTNAHAEVAIARILQPSTQDDPPLKVLILATGLSTGLWMALQRLAELTMQVVAK